jgi:hypothetical protein
MLVYFMLGNRWKFSQNYCVRRSRRGGKGHDFCRRFSHHLCRGIYLSDRIDRIFLLLALMRISRGAYHIVATFDLAGDASAPKFKGVRGGYAPHHKYPSIDYMVSGFHSYGNEGLHCPGERLKVCIGFPGWHFFCRSVKVGDSFDVYELDRLVECGLTE